MTYMPTNTVIENADLSGSTPRDEYARRVLTAAATLVSARMSRRRIGVEAGGHDHDELQATRAAAYAVAPGFDVTVDDVARDIDRQALVLLADEIATYHEHIGG